MYLIFGGECYYASGGANDLIEEHEDESCAIQRAVELIGLFAIIHKAKQEDIDWDYDEGHKIEWTQVYSVDRGEVIYKSESTPYGENSGTISIKSNSESN